MYNAMLNHPDVRAGKVDLQFDQAVHLRRLGAAGRDAPQFEEKTGAVMLEGYSLTEAMMACCVNPVRGQSKIGSIGMPLPDVDARIVDVEDPAQRDDDRRGRRADPARATVDARVLEQPARDGGDAPHLRRGGPWLHTGDLAYMDGDGYIFLVDRKKDMMKTSGFQVWPREIEEVLAAHPAVHEVGVAGVPDAVKGEVAQAWVVLKPDRSVTEDELRAYCRERLAPYKVPARVEFRKELPKTMVGKVLRRMLAAETKSAP